MKYVESFFSLIIAYLFFLAFIKRYEHHDSHYWVALDLLVATIWTILAYRSVQSK